MTFPTRCKLCAFLESGHELAADPDWPAVLADLAGVSHVAIARTLTRAGYPLHATAVGRHRRGECRRGIA